jgi:hypothetical protein
MKMFLLSPSLTPMMEAASTPETSVNFYQITRRYNPEDSHLQEEDSLCLPLMQETGVSRALNAQEATSYVCRRQYVRHLLTVGTKKTKLPFFIFIFCS